MPFPTPCTHSQAAKAPQIRLVTNSSLKSRGRTGRGMPLALLALLGIAQSVARGGGASLHSLAGCLAAGGLQDGSTGGASLPPSVEGWVCREEGGNFSKQQGAEHAKR